MKSASISSTDFRTLSTLPSRQTPISPHRRVASTRLFSLKQRVCGKAGSRTAGFRYTICASYGDKESSSVSSNEKYYNSPAEALRKLLESPGIHQGPACFDALSAKLIERAGFKFCFTTGMVI